MSNRMIPMSNRILQGRVTVEEGTLPVAGVTVVGVRSNAGALAGGNGGVPLPLNRFVGIPLDQTFELEIDADANPAGDFMRISDVLPLAEHSANY